MVITSRGIHHDIGNDLAVDLYIDLIHSIVQLLVVIRPDTVIVQQTFFKRNFPVV